MTESQTTDQATEPTIEQPFTEGERVLVTAVSPGATDAYREFAVGQHATYVRPGGATLHRVRFDTPYEYEGGGRAESEMHVTGVQRVVIDDGDGRGDTITVGEQYTSLVQQSERCLTIDTRTEWRCSRPKNHGGRQHVAARQHNGEVVAVWPVTHMPTPDPQPEQPEQGSVRERVYESTRHGSPRVPRGTRIIIRSLYGGYAHEYPHLVGRVGVTDGDLDADHDVRVIPPEGETFAGPSGVVGYVYVRTWDLAPTNQPGQAEWPELQVTASEPDQAVEAVAKDEYERLARGAILVAAAQEWCHEFEDVMSGGGFGEVRCNRERAYTLEINVEFPLSTEHLDDAIRRAHRTGDVSMDVTYDKSIETTMRLGWTGLDDPNELNTSQLNELLHEAGVDGQDFYATTLENAEDEGEPHDADPTRGFEASADGSTWVARRDAFVFLLQTQARSRAWGEHLSEVYAHAGLPAPRAKHIEVEVTASKKMFRTSNDTRYGQAFTTDDADSLTLHKRLRFLIDNPVEDTGCHCKDHTVYGRSGDASELSPVLRNAVFNGARATLRDLYGDAAAGWGAGTEDVILSCMYCE